MPLRNYQKLKGKKWIKGKGGLLKIILANTTWSPQIGLLSSRDKTYASSAGLHVLASLLTFVRSVNVFAERRLYF